MNQDTCTTLVKLPSKISLDTADTIPKAFDTSEMMEKLGNEGVKAAAQNVEIKNKAKF